MNKKNTYYIALGGLITAFSVVIMFFTGIFPYATISLPALAGVLLIAVVIEMGTKWAVLIFAAVSVLALLLAPDKEAVLFYVAFFGYYPILKRRIEGISRKWLQWLCKIVLFNICMAAVYAVVAFTTGIPDKFGGSLYFIATVAILEVTFVIYDYALTRLVVLYYNKIKKTFKF